MDIQIRGLSWPYMVCDPKSGLAYGGDEDLQLHLRLFAYMMSLAVTFAAFT